MSEVKVVRDEQGNAIVIIPDIIFWNKQDIDWDAVKEYLKKYLGEIIENKQTKEKIEIGTKFVDEYTGSKYSEHIRGARAKAEAMINPDRKVKMMVHVKLTKGMAMAKGAAPRMENQMTYFLPNLSPSIPPATVPIAKAARNTKRHSCEVCTDTPNLSIRKKVK